MPAGGLRGQGRRSVRPRRASGRCRPSGRSRSRHPRREGAACHGRGRRRSGWPPARAPQQQRPARRAGSPGRPQRRGAPPRTRREPLSLPLGARRLDRSRPRQPPGPSGHECLSAIVARCWIADRMSGWRNRSEGPSITTSRAATAGVRAAPGTPAAALISARPSRSSNAAINRSHCVSAGKSSARTANSRSRRALSGRTSGSTSPDTIVANRCRELGKRERIRLPPPGRSGREPIGRDQGARPDTISRAS